MKEGPKHFDWWKKLVDENLWSFTVSSSVSWTLFPVISFTVQKPTVFWNHRYITISFGKHFFTSRFSTFLCKSLKIASFLPIFSSLIFSTFSFCFVFGDSSHDFLLHCFLYFVFYLFLSLTLYLFVSLFSLFPPCLGSSQSSALTISVSPCGDNISCGHRRHSNITRKWSIIFTQKTCRKYAEGIMERFCKYIGSTYMQEILRK